MTKYGYIRQKRSLMFFLNRNSNNDVVLTLSEKVTLDSPKFLFAFTNDYTRESIYFICADESVNPDRYNEFNIELVEIIGDQDLLHGKILWSLSGTYSYVIYEQESSTNLDPDLTVGIVETGKLKMIDPNENYIRQLG